MSAERILEENPKDLAPYGLDKPKSRVVMTLTDGSTLELLGGDMAPTKNAYYAMKKGDNKIYTVSPYPGERLYLKWGDLRDKKLPSFDPKEVMHIRVVSGNTKIEVEKKEDDDVFVSSFSTHVLTSPYKLKRAVDPETFQVLLHAVRELKIRSFVEDQPASLAPYGLDKPAFDVYVQAGNMSLHILLGKANERLNEVYAKLDSEPAVFTIDDIRKDISMKPFSLIDKFPLIIGIDKVDSMVVKGPGKVFTSEIKREKKKVTEKDKDGKETTKEETKETFFFNGKEVEEKSFKEFYQACIGLLADSERPAGPLKASNPEVSIEYRLNSPAGKKAVIQFVPEGRDFYAALQEGVAEFLVSKVQVDKIFETADKVAPVAKK